MTLSLEQSSSLSAQTFVRPLRCLIRQRPPFLGLFPETSSAADRRFLTFASLPSLNLALSHSLSECVQEILQCIFSMGVEENAGNLFTPAAFSAEYPYICR